METTRRAWILFVAACGAREAPSLRNEPAREAAAAPSAVASHTTSDSRDCPGSGGGTLRVGTTTYDVFLDICADGDQRTARLTLRTASPATSRVDIVDTWTARADDRETYEMPAVMKGPNGTDAVILVHEGRDGWTVVTARTFDGTAWHQVFDTSSARIRVEDRSNYARVTRCTSASDVWCDDRDEVYEDWTWDGTKMTTKPAAN